MQDSWARIERRLAELGCLEEMGLSAGASEEEISGLERHVGCALPESAKKFLSTHNGQKGFGLMFGQEFLSIAGIRQQWDNWRSIDEEEMNADCAEFMQSEPAGTIRAMYCNKSWIPFTHDAGGNHIGLDFDPDTLGKSGQVIAFGRDEDTKRIIAATFDEFLAVFVSWLERAEWNGEYLDVPDGA